MAGWNEDISAGEVVWDVDGTPLNFSPFFGSVNVAISHTTADVKRDSYGTTPYDKVITGAEVIVTIPISEADSARIAKIAGVTKSTNQHKVTGYSGTALRALAKKVYIKPVVNGVVSTTESKWCIIPLGTPPVLKATQVFSGEGDQRVVNCEIYGLPSEETGFVGVVFSFGENT